MNTWKILLFLSHEKRVVSTNSQGLRQLFLTVSWDICTNAAHLMVSLYLFGSSKDERGKQGRGPLKCQLKKPF